MAAPDARRVAALVDRQGRSRDALTVRLAALVLRLLTGWRTRSGPQGWYDDHTVAALTDALARAVRTAQGQQAASTATYLRLVLREMGVDPPGRPPSGLPRDLRGVPVEDEMGRVVSEYRRARVTGLDELAALDRAERRLDAIADTDVTLAMREASRSTLEWAGDVRWRRVIRPELSKTGTCGLCIAASDRVYSRGDLMPIHGRCKCVTLPVVTVNGETFDPGEHLNADDLKALYERAGGTDAAKLKRVRYTVHAHGELGPVLAVDGEHFWGPGEVAADTAA